MLKQYNKTFLKNLHKKVLEAKVLGKYKKLTPIEKEALNNIIKNKDKILKVSAQYLKKELSSKVIQKINQIGLSSFLKITQGLRKTYNWRSKNPFKSLVFDIGGTIYTYDQLAKIYGIENKSTKNKELVNTLNNVKSIDFNTDSETLDAISKAYKQNEY